MVTVEQIVEDGNKRERRQEIFEIVRDGIALLIIAFFVIGVGVIEGLGL